MYERNYINLELKKIEELLLKYYALLLMNDKLKIESKLEKCFNYNKKLKFIISTTKNIEPENVTMNVEYELNHDDMVNILNGYFSKQNYEIMECKYEFYETKNDIKYIHFDIKQKREKKSKVLLAKIRKNSI